MALEDEHPDVLQNIEFAIVSVYREQDNLLDSAVMRALDALIDVYRAEFRGHTPKIITLPQPESLIFERAQAICEARLGRNEIANQKQAPCGDVKTVEVILACIRKIRKSVDRWNKRGGQQGYLRFVYQYVT